MRASAWLAGAAVIAAAASARAQDAPQISVRSDLDEVEVGDPFTIEMKAMVDNGSPAPSDPQIRPPPGFRVDGPSLGTQTQINGFGARAQVRVGISASWSLTPSKPGNYTIAAPTVLWNGQRIAGSAVRIKVVPATGNPRRRRHQNNPFLLPGGPGGSGLPFPFPFDPPGFGDEEEPAAPPDLSLPAAPDPHLFLRAVLDKKSAVVGEQVTLSYYVYVRSDLFPRVRSTGQHEAPLADFVRVPLLRDGSLQQPMSITVGGQKFKVKLIDRLALFPVKAGELHTGSFSMSFAGSRAVRGDDRLSADQVISVSEPPRAGRPPGYALGDVGQMALAASVQPQRVAQGGSVAVTLELSGTGNLPQALRVPERTGVEWFDPEKKEAIEPQGGVVRGKRVFGYVVKLSNSGAVDLGEVSLPYWDPSAKAYQVAKATLGIVDVIPVAPPLGKADAPADGPKADPFVSLPGPRRAPSAWAQPARRFEGGGLFWLLLGAPPLLVTAVSAGTRAAKKARARRAELKGSPAALAAKALAEAVEAEKQGDARALAAALDRAVHLGIEAASGLKSRGVLVADLPAELTSRGLPAGLGERARAVLSACEAVRFEPAPDASRTRDLLAEARGLLADLGKLEAP